MEFPEDQSVSGIPSHCLAYLVHGKKNPRFSFMFRYLHCWILREHILIIFSVTHPCKIILKLKRKNSLLEERSNDDLTEQNFEKRIKLFVLNNTHQQSIQLCNLRKITLKAKTVLN